jgi:uncharacterized protein YjeT (DUF2065 family)
MWHELGVAVALLLVLEGIFPFANPGALRRALQNMGEFTDTQLRVAGLASMLIGLLFLVLINH